ncbi:MAG: MFS transporter [Bacteriovoracaceae bacterium]|nr:MFS transporter [Bacteriovoracaceae bacterium]
MRDVLLSKRFLPLFLTQFFGAFNDNVFKNALVILIIYKSYSLGVLNSKVMVSLAAGLFILPFFLFSATAGQLADKYSKSKIAVWVKVWELFAMLFGAAGFILDSVPLLLITLFFMGMQSSFFGPVKYSILPELLRPKELLKGNAYIEMGTFIAIPFGTVIGAFAINAGENGPIYTSLCVIGFAIIGIFSSLFIPEQPPIAPKAKINFNLFSSTFQVLKRSAKNRSVFYSIVAISWFWVIGAIFLTVIPQYGKEYLNGKVEVVTLLLVLFSVGIGVGSIICEKVSKGRLELGVIPIGAIGMTIFCVDLFLVGKPFIFHEVSRVDIREVLAHAIGIRILADFFMLALFGGVFIVPLYTLLQIRSDKNERAQVIASNNIWNALFMVTSSVVLMVLFSFNYSVSEVFLIVGISNVFVVLAIFFSIPEFFFSFVSWFLIRFVYRSKFRGLNNIPNDGGCLLVANHVSFIDWILIMGTSPRSMRFVMHKSFFKIPLMKGVFKRGGVISISTPGEDRKDFLNSFKQIDIALKNGELVCIFPEGEITYDGETTEFKRGIERIVKATPVPVVPIAINGMWGSFFSRKHGRAMSKPFSRVWSKITLVVGSPIAPEDVSAARLQTEVTSLLKGIV